MKIHVNQIPEEGRRERATYDPAALEMERDDIRLPRPFEVDAFITKAAHDLVVSADIRCPLRCACGRCLEEFDSAVEAKALFSYAIKPTDVVDITEDVRQEIMIAYPIVPLCRPDCRGLCRTCGQNLNLSACSHGAP